MRRLTLLASLITTGCLFSPSSVPTAPDAPLGDARVLDGRPDAPLAFDAAVDAEPDPCPGGSIALPLGAQRSGTLAGQSLYEPGCPGGTPSGAEDLYRVDIGAVASVDLVIDLEDSPGLDGVIEVTADCVGQPLGGACADLGAPGAGEVLVIPFVPPGRRYVAVDSLAGTGGYTVRAFLRGVVGDGATCTPDLDASRCATGLRCLELGGDTTCRALSPTADDGGNDTPCATPVVFSDDAVFAGVSDGAAEVDVVAVELAAPRTLRVTVHDGQGGCSADLVAEVLTGATCDVATVAASDDDDGLGPCPRLGAVPLPAGRSWVRIRPAAGAKLGDGAAWQLELDLM